MRILFLTRLFNPHIGGVETHVHEVAKRMLEKGHKIIVVTETHGRGGKTLDGIEVIRLEQGSEGWFKKFRIWLWFILHSEFIEKADIIHCHDVFFWMFPFRFLFPRKKIFTTFHGYETAFPPSIKAKLMRKLSEKLSNGNICVGAFIEKWYGTKPTYVTYGGVEIENKNENIKNKNGKKMRILFLGRLEEDTGIPIYLRALEKLREQNVPFEFTACGNGSLAPRVRKYGKVVGFVLEIESYIMQADIVFASSYLSIMQSLACKRYVIAAFTNPLKKDYLNMTPFRKWIAISSSPDEIAKTLTKKSQIKKSNIEKAYQWATQQTWDAVVLAYEKLWGI